MALVTPRVRVNGTGVGLVDPGSLVARGALAIGGVMVIMTGYTALHLWLRPESDRSGVAADALDAGMRRMLERDRPGAGSLSGNCDRDGNLLPRFELSALVAGGALTPTGALVMTDLTPAGRGEG
jgi:hypothetical protein